MEKQNLVTLDFAESLESERGVPNVESRNLSFIH